MDILNPSSLREDASRALARGREPKKLVVTYAIISLGISLMVTLLNLWLEQEISGTGGLSNLGTRAIFSTAQQAIPILAAISALCLELGYLGGMMRIARGQYADHTDLKVGLQKFWPLMRLTILQYLIYMSLGFFAVQLGTIVFTMTPWAEPAMEMLMAMSAVDPMTLTEADLLRMMAQLVPMYIIAGVLYILILIPILHKLRFAHFCLLDDSSGRALAAIRASSKLMRRKFLPMLKVDLSLLPYHAGKVLVLLILSSDLILALLNIPLNVDGSLFLVLISVAAAVLQFLLHITLRNKAEAVYLTAYDRLREKPKEGGPVTLGNIFDM